MHSSHVMIEHEEGTSTNGEPGERDSNQRWALSLGSGSDVNLLKELDMIHRMLCSCCLGLEDHVDCVDQANLSNKNNYR